MTSEERLLCACLGWPLCAERLALIRELADRSIDWRLLEQLAARHRVGGLVGNALVEAGLKLPRDIRGAFAREVKNAGQSELRSAVEAQRICRLLADAGMKPRLIKGPAVALMAFGRLGLRINRDIDIIVDRHEVDDAARHLADLGYRRIEPAPDASAATVRHWMATHKDLVFANDQGMLVELHWLLFDNRALMPEPLADPASPVRYGPFSFDTFSTVFTIVYLCVHGAQHAWSRLKWLADVAALLQQIDATALEQCLVLARRRRVYPALGQALVLSHLYLGLAIPAPLLQELQDSWRIRRLVQMAERTIFGGGAVELEDQLFGSTVKNMSHYLIASGPRYWLSELWFDATDVSAAGLPDWVQRLGLLARPVAWLVKRRTRISVSHG